LRIGKYLSYMRRAILILILVWISLVQHGQIIADHTVVDKFDDIPQYWIDQVKKMWMSYPGESHSESIRRGLELLEAYNSVYQVEVAEYTGPAPYTTSYLRADANTWGDLANETGWIRWYGEEDWYTSETAIARTKAGITYCNTIGPALSAIGFGLCYGDGGGNYITATQQYVDYCNANHYPTRVFFTTGPVDQATHLYSWTVFYNAIRSHVASDPSLILFDFADILCYNNDGSGPNTAIDPDVGLTVPFITTESASPVEGYHFSKTGALRLAKAMWWMLARIAGWDGSPFVWQGGISTDFSTGGNWAGGVVPPDNSNITIGTNPIYPCYLDKNRTLKNITASQDNRRLIVNGKQLTISGDLILLNEARIDATAPNSTLVFAGTSPQTIPSDAFINNNVPNISSSNTEGLSFGGNLLVSQNLNIISGGKLTISPSNQLTVGGSLINNGVLTLNSDANGIFSLIMGNYSGGGIANVNMYLTGGGDQTYKWHYVAVPADINNKTVFTALNQYNLLKYDDSRVKTSTFQGWVWHDGWDSVKKDQSGPSFPDLKFGAGYNFYHNLPAGYAFVNFTVNSLRAVLPDVTLQYSGDENNDPLYGLNLIGNSLTCSINWDNVTKGPGVRDAIYFTKNNSLVSYVNGAGVPGGTTGIIPPLQGFFVEASSSSGSTLGFSNEQVKTHSTVNRYKANNLNPMLRLQLQNGGAVKDETLVRFDEKATLDFDKDFDASKLFSGSINASQIYTSFGNENYVINGIPFPESSVSIPIIVKIKYPGNYSINRVQYEGLGNFNVRLIDKLNGNFSINLKDTDTYFFISDAGIFTDRFLITITNNSLGLPEISEPEKSFKVFTINRILNIELLQYDLENDKGTLTIYDLTGRRILYIKNLEWHIGNQKQVPLNIPRGVYIVDIKAGEKNYITKVTIF
jgi:hypothetical protein